MSPEQLNKKIETWLYFLVKSAARYSYREFLEDCGISEEEYEEIKEKVQSTLSVKLYV